MSVDLPRIIGILSANCLIQISFLFVNKALSEKKSTAEQKIIAIKVLLTDLDTGKLKRPSVAALQREILVGQTAQIRPLVKALVALDLHSSETNHWPSLIEAWRTFYRLELSGLTDSMCPPTSRAWAAFAKDCDSLRTRQAAEAQILWDMRQALRRGSLYVSHSLSYRAKKTLFDTTGTTVRAPGSQKPLPELLSQLCANIQVGLEHLEEAVWFEHLQIDGTKVHQHPLSPQNKDPDAEPIREEIYASFPTIHLPELMMAVDSEVRFSWILLGREPANEQDMPSPTR